ncbi:MAG: fused MFS/spermidine synthase [Anaerolineaceae bacterium]
MPEIPIPNDSFPGKKRTAYLTATVFLAGAVTMAVEFGASRLLGNVFGTSNIVWAVVIGLVLVYLTLGNWLGGRLADKKPSERVYYSVLAWAALGAGLVPLLSRPVLQAAADAFDTLNLGVLAGTFTAVILLFSIPVILLGMVTPFALKLMIQSTDNTGRISGKLSALSTLGSFLGTFLTVLVLIPWVGTYRSFLLVSSILLLAAILGLWSLRARRQGLLFLLLGMLLLALSFLGLRGSDKRTPGLVYETESAYNYIQVLEEGGFRFLRLNEGQGVHSIYHPTEYFFSGPWDQVLVAPYFNPLAVPTDVQRIALLGLAAGTSARQASLIYPLAQVDGFEIDPKIVEVGRVWFGMDLPRLTVYTEDARWGLARSDGDYDIISVDAYRPPYIPAHLVTSEFFALVYEKLSPNGVMVINIGRSAQDRSLVDTLSATVGQAFPAVFITDLPNSYNTILFAAKNPQASWQAFERNLKLLGAPGESSPIIQIMAITLGGRAETRFADRVFTDDKAPIEFMTNRLVINFLLEGDKE